MIIYKYPIVNRRHEVPAKHKIIHAGPDPSGEMCVWMEVDLLTAPVYVSFFRVGTGHEVPSGAEYVFSYNDGPFMWHVYKEYA